jgi:hypothetical protein
MAALVPLVLFVNIWQSCRYAALKAETARLVGEQANWVESNKKMVTGIAVLEAPDRIDRIAREALRLEKVLPSKILRIEVGGSEDL